MNRRQLAADHLWIARYHGERLAESYDPEEVVGVALVALVQAAKQWPGKQSFIPYATSRIVWRIRDELRKLRRKAKPTEELPCEDCLPEEEAPGVYSVRELIVQLPPDERRAVTLSYGIGCRSRSAARVAISMRIPQQKVREILRSGLLRLRYMATCEQVNG